MVSVIYYVCRKPTVEEVSDGTDVSRRNGRFSTERVPVREGVSRVWTFKSFLYIFSVKEGLNTLRLHVSNVVSRDVPIDFETTRTESKNKEGDGLVRRK